MSFSSADVQAETLSQLCCCFANIKKRLYLSREKNLNSQLIFTVYKKPSVWSSLRVSVGGTKRAQEAIQPKIILRAVQCEDHGEIHATGWRTAAP